MTKRKKPITQFEVDDIEDVRIIIKAKGRHFSIIPNRCIITDNEAIEVRKAMLMVILRSDTHYVVSTALEDLKTT